MPPGWQVRRACCKWLKETGLGITTQKTGNITGIYGIAFTLTSKRMCASIRESRQVCDKWVWNWQVHRIHPCLAESMAGFLLFATVFPATAALSVNTVDH
jgi:hypothetical protein